jgi:hypothetical protein
MRCTAGIDDTGSKDRPYADDPTAGSIAREGDSKCLNMHWDPDSQSTAVLAIAQSPGLKQIATILILLSGALVAFAGETK